MNGAEYAFLLTKEKIYPLKNIKGNDANPRLSH
jgi:hypothetical protein